MIEVWNLFAMIHELPNLINQLHHPSRLKGSVDQGHRDNAQTEMKLAQKGSLKSVKIDIDIDRNDNEVMREEVER
jgi:hypothetical protein